MDVRARLLVLCTGNAARSVMAGAALSRRLEGFEVLTAGTLTVDGMPMSWRTRAALESAGLPIPTHRSKQATSTHVNDADLIIGLAPEHVEWVRRNHRSAAAKTATLARLTESLPAHPGRLAARLDRLAFDQTELEPWEEVVDPGGGEVEVFVACAHRVVELVDALIDPLVESCSARPSGARVEH